MYRLEHSSSDGVISMDSPRRRNRRSFTCPTCHRPHHGLRCAIDDAFKAAFSDPYDCFLPCVSALRYAREERIDTGLKADPERAEPGLLPVRRWERSRRRRGRYGCGWRV